MYNSNRKTDTKKQQPKVQGTLNEVTHQRIDQINKTSQTGDAGRRFSAKTEKNTSRGGLAGASENDLRRRSMFPTGESNQSKYQARTKSVLPLPKKRVRKKLRQFYQTTLVKGEKYTLYDHYKPVKILGHGAYAVVCEAKDLRTGKSVAVKKNKSVFTELSDAKRILREIKLLMHFDHDDVIKLTDVIVPSENEIETYSDVYLIMQKMETTLARIIKSKHKLTDDHLQYFMYQMFRGLKYIHSAGVIHRDLKPENILINGSNCKLKITDFGLSRGVFKEQVNLTEYVVTRWYRAPEVMCSAKQYDEKVDVWSVGCIFAELLLGKPLFPGGNHIEQLKIIIQVMGKPKDLSWIKTPEAKTWVGNMSNYKGKKLEQVFPMATAKALQLLKNILVLDPNQRSSVLDALEEPYVEQYHDPSTETTCVPFNIGFEFEQSMNTLFGVRHMMYKELVKYRKQRSKRNKHSK